VCRKKSPLGIPRKEITNIWKASRKTKHVMLDFFDIFNSERISYVKFFLSTRSCELVCENLVNLGETNQADGSFQVKRITLGQDVFSLPRIKNCVRVSFFRALHLWCSNVQKLEQKISLNSLFSKIFFKKRAFNWSWIPEIQRW